MVLESDFSIGRALLLRGRAKGEHSNLLTSNLDGNITYGLVGQACCGLIFVEALAHMHRPVKV